MKKNVMTLDQLTDQKTNRHPVLAIILSYLLVTVGCMIYSFGVVVLIQPLKIVNGGITGILNLINIVHPIPVGILYFVVNIPLLITSFFVFGTKFTIGTVYGTLLNSTLMTLFSSLLNGYSLTDDIFIGSLCGGALLGVGLGIIMRFGASTGGTDIIMKLLHRKKPHLSGGMINIIIDVVILAAHFAIMRDFAKTFYALMTVVIENIAYDFILYGTMGSKTVYIITDKPDEIVDRLLNDISVGATIMRGTGAFTHSEKEIILCVVKNNMFPMLKNMVRDVDDKAFMIVGKSLEIYGKGYKDYHKEVL